MSKPTQSWYSMRAAAGGADISIVGDIGDWDINAAKFMQDLRALGRLNTIRLTVNSRGGSVVDAVAIYNALRFHPARVEANVLGFALSSGSLILAAADHITIPDNAWIMIHNPYAGALGDGKAMRKAAAVLDGMRDSFALGYQYAMDRRGVGLDRNEILDLMDKETWFTAEAAVKSGLADVVEQPIKMAAHFDLSKFHNTPRGVIAMAKETAKQTDANTETDEALMTPDEIRASVQADAKQIIAACKLAGKPEAAADFIAEGKSVPDVLKALAEKAGEEEDTTNAQTDVTLDPRAAKPGSKAKAAEINVTDIYARFNGTGKYRAGSRAA